MQERLSIVTLGQKFRREENNTVYVVKGIKDNAILLASEGDGKASMLIQMTNFPLVRLKPL